MFMNGDKQSRHMTTVKRGLRRVNWHKSSLKKAVAPVRTRCWVNLLRLENVPNNRNNPTTKDNMFWEIINNLKGEHLSMKADELRRWLESFDDQQLLEFHRNAQSAFRTVFTPDTYMLYCAMYQGEVNGSGLTDFCSNIILNGRWFFDDVTGNPDNFATAKDINSFNDDYRLRVNEICRKLLAQRYDERIADEMIRHAGIKECEEVWEDLEDWVGSITFEPEWNLIQGKMPRVFAKTHFGQNK